MNPVEQHPNRTQLKAFLWGQLNEAEQEAVANHIAQCDACCQLLREIPDDGLLARLGAPFQATARPLLLPLPPRAQPLPKELLEHPRYKLGKFLGSGGMGMVYQAEHRVMDRPVALKIIHRDLIRHPHIVERFRQEVKAAARLSHPNIVTAYDAEQVGELHFLVMEFVDGISLDRLVQKQGLLEIAHACNFIRQAAKGLQHAFEVGMVHRDIKPHNLMLTRKGQIKILDFGLARLATQRGIGNREWGVGNASLSSPTPDSRFPTPSVLTGLTTMGLVMGTPDYMAPEQADDSSQVDIRADIYSLGCTLYYMLVGRPLFAHGSTETKLFFQKYRQPRAITELRPDLPPGLAAIINKMMAKDPADRYPTPAEVVKALARFAKHVPARVQVADPAPQRGMHRESPAATSSTANRGPVSPTEESVLTDVRLFLARCPFCRTRIRVPDRALGASIPCPQCNSYFTAVPDENQNKKT